MRRPERKPAPDQRARDAAVAERARNVLIDAGAGTGKTSILVDRLVEMVAPTGAAPAIPIERLAAITFTRKAAGELRLRIRERLLGELAEPGVAARREAQLRHALAGLDTAHVGTIHSFADRLLRLRPVETALSPAYDIAGEDDDTLAHETFAVLMGAVQSGRLAAELAGTGAADLAGEVTATTLLALGAGLRAGSRTSERGAQHGLDALVGGFLGLRDVPPPDVPAVPFEAAAFRAAADEFIALAQRIKSGASGAVLLRRLAAALRGVRAAPDAFTALRAVRPILDRMPSDSAARKGRTFGNDAAAWALWKRFTERPAPDALSLRDRLCGPLDRALATRLVRLFPVAVALYEKVKARRQTLDQLDLLAKLRDLLAGRLAVRGDFQRMFDHIFVDEFQDTDPLQAEIVLFLCEREPRAARWEDVELRDGALTLVGDPKQSIYRFRRADIAMYDRVRALVARGRPLTVTLSANFRSVPALIHWLNDRFDRLLGVAPGPDQHFDADTGRVFQQRLVPGRQSPPGAVPVHILPVVAGGDEKPRAHEQRAQEGQVLARYLRWLVHASDVLIDDALDGQRRRVRYGDIAVLAISTSQLQFLFAALDEHDVPYASRGGRLFLADPVHRQFLLGLRALADGDDGVAEAALLRPPFFAVDPADLLRAAKTAEGEEGDDAVRRVREARAIVRGLRQRRLDRPPGATARDLLESTAFARSVALGPNAAQRLARLRELCFVLEQAAAVERLDYDAATARVREWVDDPIQLDPPYPVGTEAVQVLTVHQAKGLEFPVVVLWDCVGRWDSGRNDVGPWKMARDGRGWHMQLHGLQWEEPPGLRLRETERTYLDAERRRIVYVAATRARDLLVVPRAGATDPEKIICAGLLHEADATAMLEVQVPPAEGAPAAAAVPDGGARKREVAERWAPAAAEAARPRFRPASVSEISEAAPSTGSETARPAARSVTAADETATADGKPRAGRFGSAFGHAVHAAIGLALGDGRPSPDEAVRRAAGTAGLAEHLADAAADVGRALAALAAAGLAGPAGRELRLEYPVAAPWDDGQLLAGYVDLVAAPPGRLDVIDFKTDAPPAGAVEDVYPAYAAQVRLYARLLAAAGLRGDRSLRCGLLFTADGAIRWLDPD